MKPPILSEKELWHLSGGQNFAGAKTVTEAQRDADIKWFRERLSEIHKASNYIDESNAVWLFIEELSEN